MEELYELFYSGYSDPSTGKRRVEALSGKKSELFTDYEREKAFHYLLSKKYTTTSSLTPNAKNSEDEKLAIFITAEGIDYIESITLSQIPK